MSIGDFFPDDLKENFANRNIEVGKAILIKIEDFEINYPKYIILVSNFNHFLIAYVIINTEINQQIFPTPYLKQLHVQIDCKNHPFLSYDSFVNCSELRSFDKKQLIDFLIKNPERVVGNVTEEVLKKVHQTIVSANTIPIALKKKFGFI